MRSTKAKDQSCPGYLSVNPSFQLLLGTDRSLRPASNLNTTGKRSYTRAHFLHHACSCPASTGDMHRGARAHSKGMSMNDMLHTSSKERI
jgi:hypothetical protein